MLSVAGAAGVAAKQEAAPSLGVSQNTLRAWAEAGKIPVRQNPANRYRLFLPRDLERFLARVARKPKK